MEAEYSYILNKINHPQYKAIFERLANEERFHQSKVQELIDLFEK
jgi:rubrerythrin